MPIHFEFVSSNEKIITFPNLPLYILDSFFGKFNHLATIQTTKVAVVFMSIDMFVVQMTILEVGFLDEAALEQQGNGTVNRGLGNFLILTPEQRVKFIHVKMVMDGEYRSDYLFTLGCFSQTLIANESPEYLNFTFHGNPY
jgi:hypothetical protein